MDKYRLTDIKIEYKGHTLYRIEALKDFGGIIKGTLGGYVEGIHNLSQDGVCWIANNAKVYDSAKVFEDAKIRDFAKIYGNARIYGNALVTDHVKIYDNALVCGLAWVSNNARIYDLTKIYGEIKINDNIIINGNIKIGCNLTIYGDAVINNMRDYIVFKNWWSSGRYFIWTRSNDMWSVGRFYGTGKELIKKAYQNNEESGREYERIVKYVESIK